MKACRNQSARWLLLRRSHPAALQQLTFPLALDCHRGLALRCAGTTPQSLRPKLQERAWAHEAQLQRIQPSLLAVLAVLCVGGAQRALQRRCKCVQHACSRAVCCNVLPGHPNALRDLCCIGASTLAERLKPLATRQPRSQHLSWHQRLPQLNIQSIMASAHNAAAAHVQLFCCRPVLHQEAGRKLSTTCLPTSQPDPKTCSLHAVGTSGTTTALP